MPGPPQLERKVREKTSYFTKQEENALKNKGPPSLNYREYTDPIEKHAALWSSGTLDPKFNHRNQARKQRNKALQAYKNKTGKNIRNGNGNTRKNGITRNKNKRNKQPYPFTNIQNNPNIFGPSYNPKDPRLGDKGFG